MQITVERVNDKFALTVKEIEGVKYYCLADLMEQLGLKGTFGGLEKKIPTKINANVVWAYRVEGNHFIETLFVDAECINNLLGC